VRNVILTIVAVGLALAVTTEANAGRRRCGGTTYVQPAAVAQPAPVAQAPTTGYRTFTYQPAVAQPVYGYGANPRLNAWDYPKTDMRRYNGGNN
jgi:hypothetical protein